MSTCRQNWPHGPISDSDLNRRLMRFGLGRARLLRAVAVRRAGQCLLAGLAVLLKGCGDTLWTWQNRYNARKHLAALDARLLDDVGLRREDVMQVAQKPFWKA